MNKFIFALREAVLSLGRFVTWLSIATIAAAIFILGLFLLISHNLHNTFKGLRNQVTAEIFLEDEITSDYELIEIFEYQDWVSKVEYVSKDDASKKLSKMTNGDLLAGLEENPLPPSIIIHFTGDNDLADLAQKVDGILENRKEVITRYVPTQTMKRLDNAYRVFVGLTGLWAIIIVIGSIFIVTNTIRLAMVSKESAIVIMELVGADRDFIRIPFVLEGLLQDIISGLISAILIFLIGKGLEFIPSIEPLPTVFIFFLFVCGVLFGITGSRIAINRYTK